jgi:hypothetical protein
MWDEVIAGFVERRPIAAKLMYPAAQFPSIDRSPMIMSRLCRRPHDHVVITPALTGITPT